MKKLFIIIALLASATFGVAQQNHYSFSEVVESGQTLYFLKRSYSPQEVWVTYPCHNSGEDFYYGYLEQRLKDQSQEFMSLRHFRKEMRSIERTVIKFLDHWIEYGIKADNLTTFKTEYNAIGAALIKRIESEEKELYTLYNQI